MALAAIDFWDSFLLIEGIALKEGFQSKLFE